MPDFNHLTNEELNSMADWILKEYVKNKYYNIKGISIFIVFCTKKTFVFLN